MLAEGLEKIGHLDLVGELCTHVVYEDTKSNLRPLFLIP